MVTFPAATKKHQIQQRLNDKHTSAGSVSLMVSFCSFSSWGGFCDPCHHRLLLHGSRCSGQKSAAAWNNSPHSCHDHTKCLWAVKVGEWWTMCQTLKEFSLTPSCVLEVCSVIVKYLFQGCFHLYAVAPESFCSTFCPVTALFQNILSLKIFICI